VRATRQEPIVSTPPTPSVPDEKAHELVLRVDGFTREALRNESINVGVPESELVAFAVLYYLADVDSNRISRRRQILPLVAGADGQVDADGR
jgi:hypothetical protein